MDDAFEGFMLCKAYDVLSEGHFKKHLALCRDRGDGWAVRMHAQQNRVAHECRLIQTQIAALLEGPSAEWAQVCKDVMSSAQPPVRVFTGYCQCYLTGVFLDYSIDLSRSGKSAKETFVHMRFWHFFIFLWFTAKIEYVIRSCTKQWLEAQDAPNKAEYTALCERFRAENEPLLRQMSLLFRKAADYVQATVELYRQQFHVLPVLRPPEAFFEA
jgi:hypothetical protein